MSNSPDMIDQSYHQYGQVTNVYSYNVRIIVAALVSLLFVIIFVLLLHAYARWFLNQSRARRPPVLQARTILHLHSLPPFGDDDHVIRFPSSMDGLDSSVLGSLPTFIYKSEDYKSRLECVVCLSLFEDGDRARVMPKCQHAFHVGCIDKWLQSRSSCPICRAPAVLEERMVISLLAASEVVEGSGDCRRNSDVNGVAHRVDDRVSTVEISSDSRSESEMVKNDSPSPSSSPSPSPSPSSSSCSLIRMLSKNRSEPKVFQMALVIDS